MDQADYGFMDFILNFLNFNQKSNIFQFFLFRSATHQPEVGFAWNFNTKFLPVSAIYPENFTFLPLNLAEKLRFRTGHLKKNALYMYEYIQLTHM